MLDVMENREVMDELKFKEGSGNLYYYLYNWAVPDLQPKDIGIVLV